MATSSRTPPSGDGDAAFAARGLLRAARAATLATTVPGGQPFASLVTPAVASDGTVLLLLSELAEHTRHLRADPRCALLAGGAPAEQNPQTAPRVTVTGMAEPASSEALIARYLAVHPYANLYAGFGDFHLWELHPKGALFVGGFARAVRLRAADLAPDPAAVAAITAAEPSIIAHCNQDHPDALAQIAGLPGMWRMVGVDVDGCDLGCGDHVLRVSWAFPVAAAEQVRAELVRLARAAEPGRGASR